MQNVRMEIRELDASDIGQRITVSYPKSETQDQVTGVLSAVTHRLRMDRVTSEIEVEVGRQAYVFTEKQEGKWALHLQLHSAD